jgi:predicted dehydrogenase
LRGVDGVVVCTPLPTHFEVISEVLDSFPRAPIFSEKCLTNDLDHAKILANRAPDRLFVMDKWRYHPGIKELGDIALSNEFGEVLGIRTLKMGWGNPHSDVDSIWSLLPHDLSIVLDVLGVVPEPMSAVADSPSPEAYGLTAILGTAPWAVCEVSARSPSEVREVRLHLQRAVAILPSSYSDHVVVIRTEKEMFGKEPRGEARRISQEMPLRAELQAFVDYILDKGPAPKSSTEEGRQIVEAVVRLRTMAGIEAG